ncbi:hypothetical protein DFH08DRAFT_798207 [Mycena albidolilacea]|uniref:Uncharacterized protein n=1 Tax=Mycena albidolilacea TaxID=1033008 RepID=A0AAD7F1M1_9AGAR|nr:hypothetical protein DFH08DRAFT_798207 [Mycena albidolilacea]
MAGIESQVAAVTLEVLDRVLRLDGMFAFSTLLAVGPSDNAPMCGMQNRWLTPGSTARMMLLGWPWSLGRRDGSSACMWWGRRVVLRIRQLFSPENTYSLTNCAIPRHFGPGSPDTSDSRTSVPQLALWGDDPLPRQYGFPHLRMLWGNVPLPPPNSHFGVPTSPPWVGPVMDAANTEAEQKNWLLHEGRSLPAHDYLEETSPTPSWWWPANIKCLHSEASDKELYLKYQFRCQSLGTMYNITGPDIARILPGY